jgi:hypothetical protein
MASSRIACLFRSENCNEVALRRDIPPDENNRRGAGDLYITGPGVRDRAIGVGNEPSEVDELAAMATQTVGGGMRRYIRIWGRLRQS